MNTLDLVQMQKINGGCKKCNRLMRRYNRLTSRGRAKAAEKVLQKLQDYHSCQC